MDTPARKKRHDAISAAAYDLLAEHGYSGTSMLRVAQKAKASNETLYRWYGNKDGLFRAMVEDNAAQTRLLLLNAIDEGGDPWHTLERVAPVFLAMLLGERAVLLNRAAAADPTGALGAAISAGGRQEILPLLERVIAGVCPRDRVYAPEATRVFLSLLVEDLQVRRIIHDYPALTDEDIAARCAKALRDFRNLLAQ